MPPLLRHAVRYLPWIGLVATAPAAADTGGALFIKGGNLFLTESHQILDGNQERFRTGSEGTFTLGYEARKKRGLSFGIEFLSYRNSFTTTAGTEGKTRTTLAMFVFKKYFDTAESIHPYVGLGVGGGEREYSYPTGFSTTSDIAGSLAGQLVAGIEFRTGSNLALALELKGVGVSKDGFGANDFNPSGVGAFIGVGGYW